MRQRILFIATLIAVFGLQAPLCALACSVPALSSAAAQPQSCHGDAQSSVPAEHTSHEDCGCDSVVAPLLTAVELSARGVGLLPLPTFASPAETPSLLDPLRHSPLLTDLPPPNILLLKSTLVV